MAATVVRTCAAVPSLVDGKRGVADVKRTNTLAPPADRRLATVTQMIGCHVLVVVRRVDSLRKTHHSGDVDLVPRSGVLVWGLKAQEFGHEGILHRLIVATRI